MLRRTGRYCQRLWRVNRLCLSPRRQHSILKSLFIGVSRRLRNSHGPLEQDLLTPSLVMILQKGKLPMCPLTQTWLTRSAVFLWYAVTLVTLPLGVGVLGQGNASSRLCARCLWKRRKHARHFSSNTGFEKHSVFFIVTPMTLNFIGISLA